MKKNKFLIVKRKYSDKIHGSEWAFPGGIVNKNEDIFAALKREIKEETNIDLGEKIEKVSEYEYTRPNKEITVGICFLCIAMNNNIILNEELTDYAWITSDKLKNYSHVHGLENEVKKAFKLK
ncbi:NUDIX hydrolase [Candidatus Woesearchaeota archaeon]|nr:NUDIX hydrolase [Candidatus Woesearchaeota archaeon]